jgi:5-methyltetrahydropteroyltriglutamate--homocysteine methyltransferase
MLPTTVTGSWPRPVWYDEGLWRRPLSTRLNDVRFREQFLDAVATIISDQEQAGLDILTNGDFHLDPDLGGRAWLLYLVERLGGVSEVDGVPTEEWIYPPGTILHEVMGGWRYPAVVDELGEGVALEFAKIWRVAQARTKRPIKFGSVSAQVAASVLDVQTPKYKADKHDLMWDMATQLNRELRALVAAGCKVIQIEDPMIHLTSVTNDDRGYLNFLVDVLNRELEGLEEAEVWVHCCWGNPNMQLVLEDTSYQRSIELYLDKVNLDVWTIEVKDNPKPTLELLKPYQGHLKKKIAVGIVNHRTLMVDSADAVAADIRRALEFIDVENLILTTNCGFGRQGFNRLVAFYKASSIAQGANIVRRELGLPETEIPSTNPRLQID